MAHLLVSRRLFRLALGLVLVPSVASAHTALKRSDPGKDARLGTAPARITLWFTAKPQLAFSSITLVGPNGEVALGPVVEDTTFVLAASIGRPLPAGEYTVRWQTAGADGHPIRGEFGFAVTGDAAQGVDSAAAMPSAQKTDQALTPNGELHPGPQYRAIRWIEFVALLTILGALGFRGVVLSAVASRGFAVADAADRARRLGQSAVGLYFIAAAIRLYEQSTMLVGNDDALSSRSLATLLTDTTWGLGWLIGVSGAMLVLLGWKLSKRYGFGVVLVIMGAVGLVTAPGLTGHATTLTPTAPSVAFDALHVASAGLWVGGLAIMLFAGIPAMLRMPEETRHPAISALVNSFHPLALLCAPLVVLSGLVAAKYRLPVLAALWTTEYGRVLLLKVALVVIVLAMGAYNSARVRRRLGSFESTRHVRLTSSVELAFAALVVAVTTVLVVTPMPIYVGGQ